MIHQYYCIILKLSDSLVFNKLKTIFQTMISFFQEIYKLHAYKWTKKKGETSIRKSMYLILNVSFFCTLYLVFD